MGFGGVGQVEVRFGRVWPRRDKQTNEQKGKIELLSQWTMEGWDGQNYVRFNEPGRIFVPCRCTGHHHRRTAHRCKWSTWAPLLCQSPWNTGPSSLQRSLCCGSQSTRTPLKICWKQCSDCHCWSPTTMIASLCWRRLWRCSNPYKEACPPRWSYKYTLYQIWSKDKVLWLLPLWPGHLSYKGGTQYWSWSTLRQRFSSRPVSHSYSVSRSCNCIWSLQHRGDWETREESPLSS